ncbi:MAG: DNA mismatch repair endonuclease MutL [Treponema sp.]|nr:DNA mismatch repair endonuclease MutL [Treponema sp.]
MGEEDSRQTETNSQKNRRPVRTLSVDVARKIAAGEVIDRPCAIVRELMDNAVDSGATDISVEIAGGGIEKIRIADNGSGMTHDDLAACARPHATSKISNAEDLLNLTTLGFRGEALASIAAVSRLSIMSGTNKMRASITEDHIIETIPPVQNGQGTIVMSEGLFENFPARRQFLKRASSETMMCRETFVEKALPRTDIAFRLSIDGQIRYDLPRDVSLADRFTAALEIKESPALFSELKASAENWSFRLVIGEPAVWRNDRKQLFIYVNGRRVQEYSLMQAVEYGCQGFFPNGTHPVAALFVEMNPALVDFNIHPAKKEVRFKDSSELHHDVSSTVRSFFRAYGIKASRDNDTVERNWTQMNTVADKENARQTSSYAQVQNRFEQPQMDFSERLIAEPQDNSFSSTPNTFGAQSNTFSTQNDAPPQKNNSDFRSRFFDYDRAPAAEKAFSSFTHTSRLAEAALSALDDTPPQSTPLSQSTGDFSPSATDFTSSQSTPMFAPATADSDGITYIGNALGTFILVEKDNTLYFIDQHAAHERILFDKILANGGEKQPLLVPYVITTSSAEEDNYISANLSALADAGFTGEKTAEGRFEFSTVPVRWKGTEQDLHDALLVTQVSVNEIIWKVAAMTACKAAVKDGYVLDKATSAQLAKDALALPDPHCPHGRPVWTTITKEQLFMRIRRTR